MKTGIIIAFLLLPVLGFCQQFIGKNHAVVITELKKTKPGTEKPVLTETDSVITVTRKGTGSYSVSHFYYFDKTRKNITEKVVAACESCYTNLLSGLLKQGKYKWKKINENQYVSRFEDKMTIELPVEKSDYYFTILRTDWSRTLYNLLVGK